MDFAFSPMEVEKRQTDFRHRMTRLPNLRVLPEQVGIDIAPTSTGSVATLTGTVATERERKIVEQLLRLEPGIDSVRNELVVDAGKIYETVPKLDPGADTK